ncbi:MAG: hypothetical protein M1127_02020 [Patescibacteria group bacterium]|nr:hypothetical protein [Patescibacteria group bacterium]
MAKFENKPISAKEIEDARKRKDEDFFDDILAAFQEKSRIKVVARNTHLEIPKELEGARHLSEAEMKKLIKEMDAYGVGEGGEGEVSYANSLIMKKSGKEKPEQSRTDYIKVEWQNGLTLVYHNDFEQGRRFIIGVMKDEDDNDEEHVFVLEGGWEENFDFEIIPKENPHQLEFNK